MGKIAFIDLAAQRNRIGTQIDAAVQRVLEGGQYILGPEVSELEAKLAAYAGARHCVTCANGTDALVLLLMAEGIGPGDAVFIPAFTFVATAEAVCLVGATPFFCDVLKDSFNLDPASLDAAVPQARAMGLTPRAVMPVDLFGQPADYRRLLPLAEEHGLIVICDAAQSFGASLDNRRVGSFGRATTTSFFPAKPLGCYGDGGAIFTDDDALADLLRSLRFHGKGGDKYDNVRIGLNSRLDTVQAAVLLEKLKILEDEIEARQVVAARYKEGLGAMASPAPMRGALSAWAQYTLIVEDRAGFMEKAKAADVPTAVYYPIPLSRQTGYRQCPVVAGGVPVSEWLAERVVSLPMHPYLTEDVQDYIVKAISRSSR